jgi:hypothetical protein
VRGEDVLRKRMNESELLEEDEVRKRLPYDGGYLLKTPLFTRK